MGEALNARDLQSGEHEAWNRFVASAPAGSTYADTRYLDLLCRTGGGRFRVRGVFKGDDLVGGVPLYERRSATGTWVGPQLLLYYNGFVLRDYDSRYPARGTRRQLRILEALERSVRQSGYVRVSLRSRPPIHDLRIFQSRGWSVGPGYTYVVPVSDLEEAWSRMEQNLRRLVGRAREEGVHVTEDGDFDAFFRLHHGVHQRKGAPLYLPEPAYRRFVQGLLERRLGRLLHARLPTGEPVSTQLVLTGDHPVTHTVCAATHEGHATSGATALLRWEAFRRLSEAGYVANDLTDAALNPVTRFKQQLGGALELSLATSRQDSHAFRVESGLRSGAKWGRRVARAAVHRGTGWLGNGSHPSGRGRS